METIRGKIAPQLTATALQQYRAAYINVLIDLGTGDGRFVRQAATANPATLAIGVDACRENLRAASRAAPPNALFIIADALALPSELRGLGSKITINFPWGSLLGGLLAADPTLLDRLNAIAQPGAQLEVRLNSGALAEHGWTLEPGAAQVARALRLAGFTLRPPQLLGPAELRACPSTWAKRLAFGRDPRALLLRGAR